MGAERGEQPSPRCQKQRAHGGNAEQDGAMLAEGSKTSSASNPPCSGRSTIPVPSCAFAAPPCFKLPPRSCWVPCPIRSWGPGPAPGGAPCALAVPSGHGSGCRRHRRGMVGSGKRGWCQQGSSVPAGPIAAAEACGGNWWHVGQGLQSSCPALGGEELLCSALVPAKLCPATAPLNALLSNTQAGFQVSVGNLWAITHPCSRLVSPHSARCQNEVTAVPCHL